MTILVVDDQPNLARVTAVALRLLDCQTKTATSIASAQRVLAEEKIDAVLLDVNMAGESGFEFLSELAAGPAPMPVVMVTAQSKDEVAAEAAARGAFDCMIKPFSLDDLRRQIERIAGHLAQSRGKTSPPHASLD